MIKLLTSLIFLLSASNACAKAPIRVGVIDTGLDLKDARFQKHLCKFGHESFTDTGIVDELGHGTHVAGIIQQYAGDANYCMVIIKYYDPTVSDHVNADRMVEAINYADNLNLDYVNISSYGYEYLTEEYIAIRRARSTTFVTVAGNDGMNARVYPCAYHVPNIRCVGALDKAGINRYHWSNYGSWVTDWMIGEKVWSTLPNGREGYLSGTSMAAPALTGALISGKLK